MPSAQHSYASAWMRQHHPAAYLAGLLTEHPGMWPLSTLANEAKRWGVGLRAVCLNQSAVAYRAETAKAVRLPLTALDGLSDDASRLIVQERLTGGRFTTLQNAYDRLPAPDRHPGTRWWPPGHWTVWAWIAAPLPISFR